MVKYRPTCGRNEASRLTFDFSFYKITVSSVHVKLFRSSISFLFPLQLFFALFASILLQNQIESKPFGETQALDETQEWFTNEPREAVRIETSGVRGKRDVTYNMTDLCHPPHFQQSTSCLMGVYSCYGFLEYVCGRLSFGCLSNVPRHGYPKCEGKYDFVKIDLGSKGKFNVRRTAGCKCAK